MKYEIKHKLTGDILFSLECASLILCVEAAVKCNVDLYNANLSNANLCDANLYNANLSNVDLYNANLSNAILCNANLYNANLSNANLSNANLSNADLCSADATIDAGTPDGWPCIGWLKEDTIMLRVGCRNKTLAEGREYWADKDDRREIMAALDYIEAVATIRGWTQVKREATA